MDGSVTDQELKEAVRLALEEIEKMSQEELEAAIEECTPKCTPDSCYGECQGMGHCDVCKKFRGE